MAHLPLLLLPSPAAFIVLALHSSQTNGFLSASPDLWGTRTAAGGLVWNSVASPEIINGGIWKWCTSHVWGETCDKPNLTFRPHGSCGSQTKLSANSCPDGRTRTHFWYGAVQWWWVCPTSQNNQLYWEQCPCLTHAWWVSKMIWGSHLAWRCFVDKQPTHRYDISWWSEQPSHVTIHLLVMVS